MTKKMIIYIKKKQQKNMRSSVLNAILNESD